MTKELNPAEKAWQTATRQGPRPRSQIAPVHARRNQFRGTAAGQKGRGPSRSLMAIRDVMRARGFPISHQLVAHTLQRYAADAAGVVA